MDLQIFPFAGIVGTLKASAETCGNTSPSLKQVIEDAEIVMKARYNQVGLSKLAAGQDEARGFEQERLDHKTADRIIPLCARLDRQIKNVEAWTATQGAQFIRELQMRR